MKRTSQQVLILQAKGIRIGFHAEHSQATASRVHWHSPVRKSSQMWSSLSQIARKKGTLHQIYKHVTRPPVLAVPVLEGGGCHAGLCILSLPNKERKIRLIILIIRIYPSPSTNERTLQQVLILSGNKSDPKRSPCCTFASHSLVGAFAFAGVVQAPLMVGPAKANQMRGTCKNPSTLTGEETLYIDFQYCALQTLNSASHVYNTTLSQESTSSDGSASGCGLP